MGFWDTFYSLCEVKKEKPNTVCSNLGLSTATATSWKKGSSPNGETLLKLSQYFNVSTDYLLTGKEYNGTSINGNHIKGDNNVQAIKGTVTINHTNGTYKDIEDYLSALPRSEQYHAIGDILELLEKKYKLNEKQ